MAMITTYLHFTGNIAIPNNAPSNAGGANLVNLIAKYEAKFLNDVLGYKLNDLLQQNINEPSGIYHDLLVGKTYIDLNDNTQYWQGFREIGQSPIANYIYCMWQKQQNTQTTAVGERKGKFENMQENSGAYKFKDAWNEMVDWLFIMDEFLTINKSVYPNYIGFTYPTYGYVYNNYLPSNIAYFRKVSTIL